MLCRIYKKCTHAQRATKENDTSSMEEVLASLPEIDDILPHRHPLGGVSESTPQQQSLMPPEPTSENGYLMDSLHRGMMLNTGVISMQEHLQTASAVTNEWRCMDPTYGNHNHNHRYTTASSQAMASLAPRPQTLNTTGLPMAMNHQFQQPTQRSYNHQVHIAVEKPGIGARSASDEEVQSALRCSRGFSSSNDGSLEAMFPTMSFENSHAQSTLSYANPAMATSNWINSSYDCL